MTLRVVGAGLGRTGTHSLKLAFEQLLGGRCYHMVEVVGRPDDITSWRDAAIGRPTDWQSLFADYSAAVDWPAAGFYRAISDAFPQAIVVLSTRASSEAWWESASRTIFEGMRFEGEPTDPFDQMWSAVASATFTAEFRDRAAAIAAYERHNADVRSTVDSARLTEWQPGDGWEPLCDALGLPVPDDPFPHVNTTEQFRAFLGLDEPTAT